MLKQLLIYANSDLYHYGGMSLIYQLAHESESGDAQYYIERYKSSFYNKKISELHIVYLLLDPLNGVTEVLLNEFAQNPLKVKTIINPKAATVVKKAVPVPEPEPDYDEEEEEAE